MVSGVDIALSTGLAQVVIRARRAMEDTTSSVKEYTDGTRKVALKTFVPRADDRLHFASIATDALMNGLLVALGYLDFGLPCLGTLILCTLLFLEQGLALPCFVGLTVNGHQLEFS